MLEVTAPVTCNVVCFRIKPEGLDEAQVEKLNRALLSRLLDEEPFVISDTRLLRVGIRCGLVA